MPTIGRVIAVSILCSYSEFFCGVVVYVCNTESMAEILCHFSHPSPSVLVPALRTVGNIVTGDDLQTQVSSNS